MKYFIVYFLLSLGFATQAQPPNANNREQKIEALYIAYMTRELSLTEDEAQKFWPVHAQFDGEIRALKMESAELERQQAILNIKKKYQDRFTKILGATRTNDFFVKDGEFRKKLIERLKKMRKQNQNAPGQQRSLRQNNFP